MERGSMMSMDARRLTTRAMRPCDRANSGFFGEPANPELIGELGGELEDDISTLRLEERVEEVHIASTREEEAMAGSGGLLTPGDLLNPNALSGGRGMTQADSSDGRWDKRSRRRRRCRNRTDRCRRG